MTWVKLVNRLFPYIEPLTPNEKMANEDSLNADVKAISATKFDHNEARALDEAQRVAAAEIERVRTSETKAAIYLAVLAALVPLVITLQAATWENKSGPAPEYLKLGALALATIYVAAAGYHAFRTLRVSGFERLGERQVVSAWRSHRSLQRLARNTLLASRRSRDAVNLKVTHIKVTHEHLLRAFGAFVILLLLDPVFYAMGFRNDVPESRANQAIISKTRITSEVEVQLSGPGSIDRITDPESDLTRQEEVGVQPLPSPSTDSEAGPTATRKQP